VRGKEIVARGGKCGITYRHRVLWLLEVSPWSKKTE
jgi:hypothetical protein